MNRIEVLSVGIATVDNIVLVERYPDRDERVIALEHARSIGGPATVAAITMSRLGVKVALSAVVGRDEGGDHVIETLRKEGVDTSLVERSETPTTQSTIVISRSEQSRAIMVKPERIASRKPQGELPLWIHADHFGATVIKEWGIKRGQGSKLSLDVGYPFEGLSPSDWDLYVPSEKISVDTSTAARDKNLVVISHGERGSAYSDGTVSGLAPAIAVDVVSTLGAGDVFHGAMVATQVWGMRIDEATAFANVVAGLSCKGLDGYSAVPSREEVLDYMKVSVK
jgi:sugar/nucleoside kinase (ribokinase family)